MMTPQNARIWKRWKNNHSQLILWHLHLLPWMKECFWLTLLTSGDLYHLDVTSIDLEMNKKLQKILQYHHVHHHIMEVSTSLLNQHLHLDHDLHQASLIRCQNLPVWRDRRILQIQIQFIKMNLSDSKDKMINSDRLWKKKNMKWRQGIYQGSTNRKNGSPWRLFAYNSFPLIPDKDLKAYIDTMMVNIIEDAPDLLQAMSRPTNGTSSLKRSQSTRGSWFGGKWRRISFDLEWPLTNIQFSTSRICEYAILSIKQ